MVQDKVVRVNKAADEFSQGLVKFVGDLKKALDDGWQPGQDIPAILSATLADLMPALKDLKDLGPGLNEDLSAFIRSFECGAHDMAFLFVGAK